MRGAGRLAPGPEVKPSAAEPLPVLFGIVAALTAGTLPPAHAYDTEPPGEPAVLRIEATFSESPAGVTVTLRADEIRSHQEQRPRFTAPLRPRPEQS
jgi:hypothetical protein